MQFIHANVNNFKAAGGQHHPHKDFVNLVYVYFCDILLF